MKYLHLSVCKDQSVAVLKLVDLCLTYILKVCITIYVKLNSISIFLKKP